MEAVIWDPYIVWFLQAESLMILTVASCRIAGLDLFFLLASVDPQPEMMSDEPGS